MTMVLVLVLVWILEPLSHRQCRTTDRQFYQITAKSLAHSSTDRQFGQIINHWHTRRRTDNSAKSLAHSSTDRHFGQIKNHKLSTDGGGGMWYHMAVIHPPMPVGRRANDGRMSVPERGNFLFVYRSAPYMNGSPNIYGAVPIYVWAHPFTFS
jgi:hypothetical protein